MITADPGLIKSSPSPLHIDLVGSQFTVVPYLLVVCFQFLVNFMINGIVCLLVPDVTEQADQTATNSAFIMGVSLFVCGVISATVNIRALVLSDGPRPVLTAASYVYLVVIIGLGSLVWWLLIAIRPLPFIVGREPLPLDVDSWIFVSFAWVACDRVGRSIDGLACCIRLTWKRVSVFVGAVLLGICAIGVPVTWLVLTPIHKFGHLPPACPAFYLLGLILLAVITSDWPSTASGRIRRVG